MKRNHLLLTALAASLTIALSGCVYACNQSWEDLTPAEQEEVRQAYEDIRSEWTSAFSGGASEDCFARDILRQVDQLLR